MSTRVQNEKKFGQWAGRILKAKRADGAADTAALEREIDERVYRLYGLTAGEIKIVEETSR